MNGEITVLYVDDDPISLRTRGGVLDAYEGIDVVTERSARDGLERLADSDVECVLSDLEMPDLDGIAFLEAVRADRPNLPFIVFTGRESEAAISATFEAEATDYIFKSVGLVSYDLVAKRIERAVEHYRMQRRFPPVGAERRIDRSSDDRRLSRDGGGRP